MKKFALRRYRKIFLEAVFRHIRYVMLMFPIDMELTITSIRIDHFTVVCSVTCPLNGSEAGSDLVLIQTSLFCCVNQVVLLQTGRKGLYQSKVTSSLVCFHRLGNLAPNCKKVYS